MSTFELFNWIADPASARVRRFVAEHSLEEFVRFRNMFYPEVKQDFEARGGTYAPALWDGETLVEGAEAAIARLEAFLDVGRS